MFQWLWKIFIFPFTSSNKAEIEIDIASNSRMYKLLGDRGIFVNIRLMDSTYALPKKEWLLTPYYNWYKKILKGLRIKGWREDFDCDDYAKLYWNLSQACHAKAKTESEGIAIGFVAYKKDSGGGHAVNIAICDTLIFIEPQTGKEMELSNKEISSIYYVLF